MGRSCGNHHRQSQRRHVEPLISTRREDGLWQSIERDDEELASHLEDHDPGSTIGKTPVVKEDEAAPRDLAHHPQEPHGCIATATSTPSTLETLSAPDIKPVNTEIPSASHRHPTPTRADLLARVLNCPLPHPGLSTPIHPVPDILQTVSPSPHQPRPGAKRNRGRPRKSRNIPNWNKRRRVRFSDPILPDSETPPQHRDAHVFVRLLKIIVNIDDPHPPQRQELAWNNRAKGWRLAGERSERNIGDIAELFDDLTEHGSLLKVLLAPTVGRGAREPVEMSWNAEKCCFYGENQDLGTFSVALGEMKDMVKNPWARQFVGYVLG